MEADDARESGLFPRDLNSLFTVSPHNRKRKERSGADTSSANVVAGTGATADEDLERLQVIVRIRPLLLGTASSTEACIHATSAGALAIAAPEDSQSYKNGDRGQPYTFSQVFGQGTTQQGYFAQTAAPMVRNLARGSRESGVFMAYGISASGKTFTVEGTKSEPGIVPQALDLLFQELSQAPGDAPGVFVSHYEVYHESIFDLLDQSRKPMPLGPRPALPIKEDAQGRVFVAGLSQVRVQDAPGAMELLRRSSRQRQKASTGLNLQSSRSHSVFGISLRWRPGDEESSMGQVPEDAEGSGTEGLFWGRLSIVDLAGSERAQRTGNEGARLKESVAINSSLMTLGRCLEALRWNQRHAGADQRIVPYRESKVTHLFRDVLRGWGRIVLSVSVSPAASDYDETSRVLRYAATAAQINIVATAAAAPPRPLRALSPNITKKRRLQAAAPAAERKKQPRPWVDVTEADPDGTSTSAEDLTELKAEVLRLAAENERLAAEVELLTKEASNMRQQEAEKELAVRAEVAQESRKILQQMEAEYQERVAAARQQAGREEKRRTRMTLVFPSASAPVLAQAGAEDTSRADDSEGEESSSDEDSAAAGTTADGAAHQELLLRLQEAGERAEAAEAASHQHTSAAASEAAALFAAERSVAEATQRAEAAEAALQGALQHHAEAVRRAEQAVTAATLRAEHAEIALRDACAAMGPDRTAQAAYAVVAAEERANVAEMALGQANELHTAAAAGLAMQLMEVQQARTAASQRAEGLEAELSACQQQHAAAADAIAGQLREAQQRAGEAGAELAAVRCELAAVQGQVEQQTQEQATLQLKISQQVASQQSVSKQLQDAQHELEAERDAAVARVAESEGIAAGLRQELEAAVAAREEDKMQLQANLDMNTEILERALEQARKENGTLQRRLEIALGLHAPASHGSGEASGPLTGTPAAGGTPLAIALARARHEAALQGFSAHVHLTPCTEAPKSGTPAEPQGMTRQGPATASCLQAEQRPETASPTREHGTEPGSRRGSLLDSFATALHSTSPASLAPPTQNPAPDLVQQRLAPREGEAGAHKPDESAQMVLPVKPAASSPDAVPGTDMNGASQQQQQQDHLAQSEPAGESTATHPEPSHGQSVHSSGQQAEAPAASHQTQATLPDHTEATTAAADVPSKDAAGSSAEQPPACTLDDAQVQSGCTAEQQHPPRKRKRRLAPKTPMARGLCEALADASPDDIHALTSSPIAGRTRHARRL